MVATAKVLSPLDRESVGLAQFLMVSMFAPAFSYGSGPIVETHSIQGKVVFVFWACLVAALSPPSTTRQYAAPIAGGSGSAKSAVTQLGQ